MRRATTGSLAASRTRKAKPQAGRYAVTLKREGYKCAWLQQKSPKFRDLVFKYFTQSRPVEIRHWTDFFEFKGHKIKAIINQLGPPTEVTKVPPPYEREGTQYRWDDADPEHVIFMFERSGKVHRANTTRKADWPGWRGHARPTPP